MNVLRRILITIMIALTFAAGPSLQSESRIAHEISFRTSQAEAGFLKKYIGAKIAGKVIKYGGKRAGRKAASIVGKVLRNERKKAVELAEGRAGSWLGKAGEKLGKTWPKVNQGGKSELELLKNGKKIIHDRANNCANACATLESNLRGRPASALQGTLTSMDDLASHMRKLYGKNFKFDFEGGLEPFGKKMARLPVGGRGIVYGERNGGGIPHFFSIVRNKKGFKAIDPQSDSVVDLSEFRRFFFMRTDL
jgi:hypothetical protein